MPRRPNNRADLRAHMARPLSLADERADVFGAALDARSRVRRAQAHADDANAALAAETRLLAMAEAALAAFDEAHPAPAPPMEGAQPEGEARARWLAFLARQTTKESER